MYDLIFVEAPMGKTIKKVENVKVDTATKEFLGCLAFVSQRGVEVEVGVRPHDPRANSPKT